MKINQWALAAAGLLLCLLAACAGTPPATESEPAAPPAGNGTQTPDGPRSAPDTPAPATVPAQDNGVVYQGIFLEPGGAMAPVYEALGEPLEYSEVISCLFEGGMDKTYFYDGVAIYTYPTETDERILYIEFTSAAVSTGRGVRLGDSLDSALLLYDGELTPNSETRYTAIFGPVLFSLTAADGKINAIGYELAESP